MLTLAIDKWPAFMTSQPMVMQVVTPPYDSTEVRLITSTTDRPVMLRVDDEHSDVANPKTWRRCRTIFDYDGAPLVVIRADTKGKRHKPIFHVTRPGCNAPIFTFRPYIDREHNDFAADIRINGDTVYMNARDGHRAYIELKDPYSDRGRRTLATVHRRHPTWQFTYRVDMDVRVDMLFVATICTLMDLSIIECMASNHLRRLLKWGTACMPKEFKKREKYYGIENHVPRLWL